MPGEIIRSPHLNIEIRRFGKDREMVGVLQHARAGAPPRPSFLLCRPIGQEGTRTASMYRVLSDRLAREGCHVFNFDYHGTGDSPGEENDQSLSRWAEDLQAAHEQLSVSPDRPVHWFAMSLGAQIAVRAASHASRPPSQLVLWEPVVDGPSYLETLFAGHRAELEREYHHPWERLLRQGRVEEPSAPGDVLGFMIGEQLARELQQLPVLSLAPALRRGIRIVCGIHKEQRAAFGELVDSSSGLLRLQTVEERINWLSSQAMGTAIVPADVPRTLMSTF